MDVTKEDLNKAQQVICCLISAVACCSVLQFIAVFACDAVSFLMSAP